MRDSGPAGSYGTGETLNTLRQAEVAAAFALITRFTRKNVARRHNRLQKASKRAGMQKWKKADGGLLHGTKRGGSIKVTVMRVMQ